MAGPQSDEAAQSALDRRFMAAAIRLSRRNAGRTSTNPSVGTIIVRDDGAGPMIVGTGVTAVGGRPHAETEALEEPELIETYRLSCQLRVNSDLTVRVWGRVCTTDFDEAGDRPED